MDEKHPVHFFPLTVSLSLPSFFFSFSHSVHTCACTHTLTHTFIHVPDKSGCGCCESR